MSWPHRLPGKNHSSVVSKSLASPQDCRHCGARITYCDFNPEKGIYRCPKCGGRLVAPDVDS